MKQHTHTAHTHSCECSLARCGARMRRASAGAPVCEVNYTSWKLRCPSELCSAQPDRCSGLQEMDVSSLASDLELIRQFGGGSVGFTRTVTTPSFVMAVSMAVGTASERVPCKPCGVLAPNLKLAAATFNASWGQDSYASRGTAAFAATSSDSIVGQALACLLYTSPSPRDS